MDTLVHSFDTIQVRDTETLAKYSAHPEQYKSELLTQIKEIEAIILLFGWVRHWIRFGITAPHD